MNEVTSSDIQSFAPDEAEKTELLVELINGTYTVKAMRQDYKEWLEEGRE